MSNEKTIRKACIAANPSILDLKFGCEIEKIYWYKSESDKKKGIIDWKETGHHEDGRRGIIVKDLRDDFLPMWVDYGDQLEFQIAPNDIVSFEILGREIRLADVLYMLSKQINLNRYDIVLAKFLSQCEIKTTDDEGEEIGFCHWNLLNDNLSSQSEETKAFLANLLTTQEGE